jgi:hypothetical protein
MGFKQHLLTKMTIDRLAAEIIASWGPPESGRRVDREAVKRLLTYTRLEPRHERDLDLYLDPEATDPPRVLVLDNDLAVYRTSVEDVALRKSPTVKEMLNLGNVKRILSDADVIASKREQSVRHLQGEAVGRLDLHFTAEDIRAIGRDGADALAAGNGEAVVEALTLLNEILGWSAPPLPLRLARHHVLARTRSATDGTWRCDLLVLYSLERNILGMLDDSFGPADKAQLERLQRIAGGQEAAPVEGGEIFQRLVEQVLASGRSTLPT